MGNNTYKAIRKHLKKKDYEITGNNNLVCVNSPGITPPVIN